MPEYVLDTSLDRDLWRTLDAFTQGYIEAAMWTLTDDDGESMDYLGLHDIAPSALTAIIEDCRQFQDAYAALLAQAGTDAQNGHDYLLTRNRHGAGFWDRGYPKAIGDALTDAAHAEGEVNGCVGDDGLVYFE